MAEKNRAKELTKAGFPDSAPTARRRWRWIVFSRPRNRGKHSTDSANLEPHHQPGILYERRPDQGVSYNVGDLDARLGYKTGEFSDKIDLEQRTDERKAELEALAVKLQRRNEERRQSETRYRVISELTSDFAYVARLNEQGMFVLEWISDQASHIFGYPNERIATSEQWVSIIHPDDRQTAINSLMRSAMGQATSAEIRCVRPDGSIVWLNISARPIINPVNGCVESIFGAGQDITERKLAEAALIQSQARYHTLFDESPVSLWEIDFSEIKAALDKLALEGVTDLREYFMAHLDEAQGLVERVKILDVNRRAMKLYDEAVGDEMVAFVGDLLREDSQLIFDGLAAMVEGRTFLQLEGKESDQGGEPRYTEIYFAVVGGYEHNYGRVIISILDVTARYRAEQALRREAKRLELKNAITSASI